MTLEELFVQKYNQLEEEKEGLEKEVRDLSVTLKIRENDLCKLVGVLKNGFIKLTSDGNLALSILISGDEAKKNDYLQFLHNFGITVREKANDTKRNRKNY